MRPTVASRLGAQTELGLTLVQTRRTEGRGGGVSTPAGVCQGVAEWGAGLEGRLAGGLAQGTAALGRLRRVVRGSPLRSLVAAAAVGYVARPLSPRILGGLAGRLGVLLCALAGPWALGCGIGRLARLLGLGMRLGMGDGDPDPSSPGSGEPPG
jgi:hypothetical protein